MNILSRLEELLREAKGKGLDDEYCVVLELSVLETIINQLRQQRPRHAEEGMTSEDLRAKAEEARRHFDEIFGQAYRKYSDPFWRSQFSGDRRERYHPGWSGSTSSNTPPPPPPTKEAWYQILGVPVTATKEQIVKAYRRLAMRYHPDRKPDGNRE